ncbi:MAG: hypothetical protein ABSH22_21020, partial [Tepidisphaeraceae bacterium]
MTPLTESQYFAPQTRHLIATASARRHALRSAAGWTLLATLVYAPWARGCIPPWTTQGLVFLTF